MNVKRKYEIFLKEMKKLKKEEDVSEDEIKELEDKVQKLTDKYIKDVDAAVEAKGKEIMTV